jgi:hypothetical protein
MYILIHLQKSQRDMSLVLYLLPFVKFWMVSYKPLALLHIPVKIPDRYKPLDFPPILHDLPVNYINNLPRFDGENVNITAENHIQNIEDFLDLFEVEDDHVCIRIFSLSLQGKVKNWFKNLPDASISNFHQFVNNFLDRWVIMRNVFLILEEYDHLKRHPGETVPQFLARFNKVYHAMPTDIRPPLGSSHLHYPYAFNLEMEFQLRERNIATLEEMQKIVVDVEANLLRKKAKLEALMKEKIEKEQLISSEMKLDILTNIVNEVMNNISLREELVVRKPYVLFIPERTNINVPKIFPIKPQYFDPPNDYFMYSIHNTIEDEVQNQKMEEDYPDMICMFNGISSMNDSPKLDWYNDDYTTLDFSKNSTTYDCEEEDNLQFQQNNQSVHGNYDKNDQSAENLRVSGQTLPLCFSSFKFLKELYEQVINVKEGKSFDEIVKDVSVEK